MAGHQWTTRRAADGDDRLNAADIGHLQIREGDVSR
jgi:hypothetical protein